MESKVSQHYGKYRNDVTTNGKWCILKITSEGYK